jgi:hypothetical protein
MKENRRKLKETTVRRLEKRVNMRRWNEIKKQKDTGGN